MKELFSTLEKALKYYEDAIIKEQNVIKHSQEHIKDLKRSVNRIKRKLAKELLE